MGNHIKTTEKCFLEELFDTMYSVISTLKSKIESCSKTIQVKVI